MTGDVCANCGTPLMDARLGVDGLLFCDDECHTHYVETETWEARR